MARGRWGKRAHSERVTPLDEDAAFGHRGDIHATAERVLASVIRMTSPHREEPLCDDGARRPP